VYVTGSDEHGTPIEIEAVRLSIPPKQLTDKNHAQVSDLFERWGIAFSNYTIADMITNLEESGLFTEVGLRIAEKGKMLDREVMKFKLSANVKPQ